MRILSGCLALLLLSSTALGAYERDDGIRVIPSFLHPDRPVNFKYAYDFSFGASSFAGRGRPTRAAGGATAPR